MAKWTMAAIRKANREAGHYFFSPDTMKFFRSKIYPTVYQGNGGVFFVTSEQQDEGQPRKFKVRHFDPNSGKVYPGSYAANDLNDAKGLARELAKLPTAVINPRKRRNPKRRRNAGGVRIVYNRLLGGWYVVTGPHQTPIGGRHNSKYDAQAWLRDQQAMRDARSRPNPGAPAKLAKMKVRSAVKIGPWVVRRIHRNEYTLFDHLGDVARHGDLATIIERMERGLKVRADVPQYYQMPAVPNPRGVSRRPMLYIVQFPGGGMSRIYQHKPPAVKEAKRTGGRVFSGHNTAEFQAQGLVFPARNPRGRATFSFHSRGSHFIGGGRTLKQAKKRAS